MANARTAFARWHQQHLDEGRCIVFRLPNRDRELVLVPVRIKTGESEHSLSVLVLAPLLCVCVGGRGLALGRNSRPHVLLHGRQLALV